MTTPTFRIGPQLYRDNAFHVTGLRVDAGARDVRRFQDRRTALGDLDGASAREVGMALEVLRDPVQRFLHELFAGWVDGDGEPPDGVDLLLAARHDRAVKAHRAALEGELEPAGPAAEQRDDAWSRATPMWARLAQDSELWDRMRARAAALGHPQLTDETVESLRRQLPVLLLGINAELARDGADAARQRRIMTATATAFGIGAGAVEEAFRAQTVDLLGRVSTLCGTALDEVRADPRRGAAAAVTLKKAALPLVKEAGRLLGQGNRELARVRDHLAEVLRRCSVIYYNVDESPRSAAAVLDALRTAKKQASLPDTIEKVERDLSLIELVAGRSTVGPTTYSSTYTAPVQQTPTPATEAVQRQQAAAVPPLLPSEARRRAVVWAVLSAAMIVGSRLVTGAWLFAGNPVVAGAGILFAAIALGYLVAALRPRPVARALVFAALGGLLLAWGLWWGAGPWLGVPGGLVLGVSVLAVVGALERNPLAQGWYLVGLGAAMAGAGSLGWGGLWTGGDPSVWGMGHAGLWLVLPALVVVVLGVRLVDDEVIFALPAPALATVLAALGAGAVWLFGGGGWPAFVAAVVLLLVALWSFVDDSAELNEVYGVLMLAGLLLAGVWLAIFGFRTIGTVTGGIIAAIAAMVIYGVVGRRTR